jgi:RHS repeat-associated protein
MRSGGQVYYLHGDHLGSTSLTTDAEGKVVARQLYRPYGTVRYSEGTLPTDFTYTGQRAIAGTGLVFMRARYYHAGLARFVSADTIVPEPGNPGDLNRFAYTRNNPVRYIDPSGHRAGPPLVDGICAPGTCNSAFGLKRSEAMDVTPTATPPPPYEGPGRPVAEWRQVAASQLNVEGAVLDTLAFGFSFAGMFVEVGAGIVAGSAASLDPVPGDEIAVAAVGAVATYQGTVGKFEDVLGWAGLGTTALADLYGGYTYPDFDTETGLPELVVGQDTTVELASNAVGLIPEAFIDAGVNLYQMIYSWSSLSIDLRVFIGASILV